MDDTTFSFESDNETAQNGMLGSSTMEFEQDRSQPAKIKVIGVGGGGNAVNHMYRQGIKGVDFIVCNTDAKALAASPVPVKIELGKLGAGNVPERARKLALEHKDEIREAISDDTQMLFITAGMGGGTGTGAAPIIAEIAKSIELDDEMVPRILVVAIVTMPFTFEGRRRREQAEQGIAELRKHVDAILIINNDKLRNICGNVPFSVAFSQADDVLLTAAKGIAEIITVSGYVNIDFRDVNTVMEKSGTALMGAGEGRGENRAMDAIKAATTSVLLNDNDIRGAKNILLYFSYSPQHQITMDEIGEVTDYLTTLIGDTEANIIWGNADDDNLDDQLRITLIATGFEQSSGPNIFDLADEMKKKQEEEARKKQEEEARKAAEAEAEAAARAAEEKQRLAEQQQNNGEMIIIHRAEHPSQPSNTANIENAASNTHTAPAFSDNPFDSMPSSQVGEKRVVSLNSPADDLAEAPADKKETSSQPSQNSHLDGIRVINRHIVEQSRPTQQSPAQPSFHIEQTEALATPTIETVAETKQPSTQQPKTAFPDQQVAQAFRPQNGSVDDQQVKMREERIRRMNDLLLNNPEGPAIIERMTTEELSGEAIYQENHSTNNNLSQRSAASDNPIASGFRHLFDLPD